MSSSPSWGGFSFVSLVRITAQIIATTMHAIICAMLLSFPFNTYTSAIRTLVCGLAVTSAVDILIGKGLAVTATFLFKLPFDILIQLHIHTRSCAYHLSCLIFDVFMV